MLINRILKMDHPLLWAALLVAALSLSLAACGGGDDDDGFTFTPAGTTTEVPATNTPETDGDMPTTFKVNAKDNFFDFDVIEAPANTEITVELFNDGVLPHNIAFLNEEGGTPLSNDAQGTIVLEGETTVVRFTTPGPGTYFINCTVHPLEMTAAFIVK